MIPNELKPLITSLLARSKAGDVLWEPAKALGLSREGDHAVNAGRFLIVLKQYHFEDEAEGDGVLLKFINSDGVVALEMYAHSLEQPGNDWEVLSQLYEVARRRALRADRIIEDLTQMLGGKGPIGFAAPLEETQDDDIPP